MYPVSNEFREAMLSPAQEHKVTGTIGNLSFDESNIVEGSFQISNQCTDTNDVVLGSVFVGQLTAEFTGINIEYGDWIGKVITPTFSLKVGANTWENVPLGIYTIKEANHTAYGVQITAYDRMINFDKKFKKSHFQFVSIGMYSFIEQICNDCNVSCANTEEEIEAMPNGDRVGMAIYGAMGKSSEFANDIETYRDLLFFVAQTIGCFATINRNGQLEFRRYTQNVVDEISNHYRLTGATFADYVTHYIGIYVTNLDDNNFVYYGYDSAAIQAEITATTASIAQVESDLLQVDIDLEELEREHTAHEITDEEYTTRKNALNAQKKSLQKEKKQLNKRLKWLQKALAEADDGASMDLGANPFLCDENLTVRDAERREVLGALDDISYTPFTCSVVFGMIYDLGDVIQFSGGLYNSSNDSFGCVMSYNYTLNGEVALEGFGIDPAMQLIKTRTQKSADRANTNAINSKEISSGMDAPLDDSGKENDIYVKYGTKTTYVPIHKVYFREYVKETNSLYHFERPVEMYEVPPDTGFGWDEEHGGYYLNAAGKVYSSIGTVEPDTHLIASGWFGSIMLELDVPVVDEAAWYKVSCDAQWDCPANEGRACNVGFSNWCPWDDCGIGAPAQKIQFSGGSTVTHYEYDYWFDPDQSWISSGAPVYMWIDAHFPWLPSSTGGKANFSISITNLIIEKYIDPREGTTDGGKTADVEKYVDGVYVKQTDETTGVESWKEIEYVAGIDDSAHSGLELDYKRFLHLTSEVMRAWFKADPPQAKQTFNRYCVRYTGKPDTSIEIATWDDSTSWKNKSIKKDSEGVYTLKSGGTVASGVIEKGSYKITGLVTGQRYYFNFKANFKDGTHFGNDYDKGLGIVLQTSGTISTDYFSGNPHTFDPTTGYCSFYRSTAARFYDFSFVAAASTMYMFITVGDIVDGQTSSLTLSRFVISKTEKAYIRNFYLFDLEQNDWLEYKPWGSGDESGEGGASSLTDLDDVNLNNIQNGQSLYYNSNTGEWSNGDMPIASANSVGGIKVGDNLSIDANGVLSATASSDVELIEKTQAEYDQLTPEQKADPNVIYFVTDAGGGGGGGGTTVIANPTGTPTDQLDTVQIGNIIYEIAGGGGSTSEIIPITAGDGTSSRTFTFTKTPKFIQMDWVSEIPWYFTTSFTWGAERAFFIANNSSPVTGSIYTGVSTITYGADGKSFTITGANKNCAANGEDASGQMYVQY